MTANKKRGERGRSKATLDLIDTCIEIIEQAHPITVRGVCYRLFVAQLIESMATNNTQKISRLLVWGREEGLIPWEWIVDDSRRMERQPHWKDLVGYAAAIQESYRRDFWAHQPFRVIVVSEKATVAGILSPVLDAYGVPFFPAKGFNSATKVRELAVTEANDGRIYILLYIGDYDPSGMFMSVVDLLRRLKRYGATGRLELYRVALTEQDTHSLPSFSAHDKRKDPRYPWFIENYGDRAWEVDAMNPNDLRDRVESEIKRFINEGDWEQHKLVEAAQQETVKTVAERMINAGA